MDTILKKKLLSLLYERKDGLSHDELLTVLDANDRELGDALNILVMTPFINISHKDGKRFYKLTGFGRHYIDRRGRLLFK